VDEDSAELAAWQKSYPPGYLVQTRLNIIHHTLYSCCTYAYLYVPMHMYRHTLTHMQRKKFKSVLLLISTLHFP